MEQLQSILTDLDNKAITKHQAYDLILVLFDVSKRSEQLMCEDCNQHEKMVGWKICDECYKKKFCTH